MGTLWQYKHQLEINSSIYQKILCWRTFLLWDNMFFSQMGTQKAPTFCLFSCLPALLTDSIQVAHRILVQAFSIHLHHQDVRVPHYCAVLTPSWRCHVALIVYAMCICGGIERTVTSVWPLDWTPLVPAFLDSVFQLSFIWNKFS